MTGVIAKREKFEHRQMGGRQPRDHRGNNGRDVAAGQGSPRIASKSKQELESDRKEFSLDPSEGVRPCNTWTSGLLDCERINLCCLKPLVCGNLLQQTQETNTNCIRFRRRQTQRQIPALSHSCSLTLDMFLRVPAQGAHIPVCVARTVPEPMCTLT